MDSTSSEARRRIMDGACWYMAHEQTAARGRRGRAWRAPRGNFMASLVLPLDVPAQDAALRSFAAALALHDTLIALTGRGDVFTLKWPNDVLAQGQKLAGILLETSGTGARVDHLIIGIGVNLAHAPSTDAVEPHALPPISLMQATGQAVAAEAFLDHLAPAYQRREDQLRREGFGQLRADFLAHAANLGNKITARMGDREAVGIFESLDDQGALVLRNEAGTQTIAAADIYF